MANRLTPEQQLEVVRLQPYVGKIASSFVGGAKCKGVWADDIRGEAMLACCEAVLGWVPERCPKLDPWVGRVVWTRLGRLMEYLDRRQMEYLPDENGTAGGSMVRRPNTPPVYDSLAALPEPLREVADRAWVQGESILAIMRATGLTERKVKCKLKRAKEALLRILDDTP